jgi:hypothetical protein
VITRRESTRSVYSTATTGHDRQLRRSTGNERRVYGLPYSGRTGNALGRGVAVTFPPPRRGLCVRCLAIGAVGATLRGSPLAGKPPTLCCESRVRTVGTLAMVPAAHPPRAVPDLPSRLAGSGSRAARGLVGRDGRRGHSTRATQAARRRRHRQHHRTDPRTRPLPLRPLHGRRVRVRPRRHGDGERAGAAGLPAAEQGSC